MTDSSSDSNVTANTVHQQKLSSDLHDAVHSLALLPVHIRRKHFICYFLELLKFYKINNSRSMVRIFFRCLRDAISAKIVINNAVIVEERRDVR